MIVGMLLFVIITIIIIILFIISLYMYKYSNNWYFWSAFLGGITGFCFVIGLIWILILLISVDWSFLITWLYSEV